MTKTEEQYKRLITRLRYAKPELKRADELSDEIIRKIRGLRHKGLTIQGIADSIFGWIYIPWVRRSLIGAAFILVMVFVYQQVFIIRQVRDLSSKITNISNGTPTPSIPELDRKLTIYKISAGLSSSSETKINDNKIKELIESYESLQSKYKDLIRIIDKNPHLKKYVEKELENQRNLKTNL